MSEIKVEYINHCGDDLSVVDAALLSKVSRRCLESLSRGYYVTEEGEVFGPKGKLSLNSKNQNGYPTYSTNWDGEVFGVPMHKLAALCFYGSKIFDNGVHVRHLDGNKFNLSKLNIVLGTASENELDKPEDQRIATAKIARAAQGFTPTNAKLTPDQVIEVREFYKALGGKKAGNGVVKALCEKLGVCRTVLCKIKNGEYYQNV